MESVDHMTELESRYAREKQKREAAEQMLETRSAELYAAQQALLTQQSEMESQQWLDKTLSRFDDVMRANFDRSLQEYSEAILLELGKVLNNVQGALYAVLEDENRQPYLKVVGGYACNIGQLPKSTYAMGEGMIGQAAKSKERFVLNDIGQHAQAPQASTLIQVQPQALAILPIVYNDRVKGVLELSLLDPLTTAQADLLQRLCWNLGASMESLLNQVKMQDMYAKSQEAYQQMAAQEEEMRQNLEELEATQEEMRRVQDQLKLQSDDLERIMQNVPGVIYTFQLELDTQRQGFTFVSDKSAVVLGYSPEALLADYGVGKLIDVHEEDITAFVQRITESATQLTQFIWEGRMRKADGQWLWVRAESTPTRLSDTRVSWDGILSDISERKRYEDMLHNKLEEIAQIQQAVADSKAFLDSTINSTEIMFIATDIEGTVKYWNDAASKHLGYSREEMVDKLSPAAFHVLDEIATEAERLNSVYNAGLKPGFEVFTYVPFKGESYKREWTYVDKNGRKFPVELAISAWRKGDGSIGGLLGIAQDITQRKQQEELVRTKTEELAANEEEMRQNLEELQATQEEMRRAQRILENIKREQEDEIARLNEQHTAALREVEAKQAEAELALKEAQKREKQIETQQKVMMQAIEKFKQKELEYKTRITELEKVVSN